MSPPALRVGDTGSHGGTITAGASRTRIVGIAAARVGDPYQCTMHGGQTVATGSATTRIEDKAAARDGDTATCGASFSATQTTVRIA